MAPIDFQSPIESKFDRFSEWENAMLLPGEKVEANLNMNIHRLILTNHRIINVGSQNHKNFNISLGLVEKFQVEKNILKIKLRTESSITINLDKCENFEKVFEKALESYIPFNESSLFKNSHCFERKPTDSYYEVLKHEFQRLKFDPNEWVISPKNEKFEFCETYPRYHIVLKEFEEFIQDLSNFRRKQRFLSVVYHNSENKSVIIRCSQPMIGESKNRSIIEESYLKRVCALSNSDTNKLLIFDARPPADAIRNLKNGGGSENNGFYDMGKHEFLNIINMFQVKDIFTEFIDCCESAKSDIALKNSKWIQSISHILYNSIKIAKCIKTDRSSVLIHCTDGWDRTPQLTALAKLIMDPFYRSLHGFQILVEQEWRQMGHKFEQRCAFWPQEITREFSPVFLQWLDCIFQIVSKFPNQFQFNSKYLHQLFFCINDGVNENFQFNSMKERIENQKEIFDVWTYLSQSDMKHLQNTNFNPSTEIVEIDYSVKNLLIWKEIYIMQ